MRNDEMTIQIGQITRSTCVNETTKMSVNPVRVGGGSIEDNVERIKQRYPEASRSVIQ
jgi:hypothetical protein